MTVELKMKPTAREFRKRVTEFFQDAKNTTPAMKVVAVFLDKWVQENFRSQGGNAHTGGWVPLKAGGRWVGRGARRRLDTNAKVLQKTGRLRASFTPFAEKHNAGIGSELPYSKPHEEGLGHLPQRRMLPTRHQVHTEINRRLNRWAKKVADKHDRSI